MILKLRETPSRALLGLMLSVVATFAAAALCGNPKSSVATPQTPAAQGNEIGPMQLLSATQGWVLTDKGLTWTSDGGTSWRVLTPPGTDATAILGAFFLNADDGWVVSRPLAGGSGTTQLTADVTQDGGQTWKKALVGDPNVLYGVAVSASISFVDNQRGWILVRRLSSSNFSVGDLLQTKDGGSTWSLLPPPPIADPVVFTDSAGWLAGGPGGDALYVTRDGGESWSRQSATPPGQLNGASPTYSLPNAEAGVLPVTFLRDDIAQLALYTSDDGGKSWSFSGLVSGASKIGGPGSIPAAVVDRSVIFLALDFLALDDALVTTSSDGSKRTSASSAGLPPGASITELRFVNGSTGWSRVFTTDCNGSNKDTCGSQSGLFRTSDGGASWEKLEP